MLDKTLESPLDSKEIKPVNPIGNQSWIHIGRTDAEAEIPILWPPHSKNWLIRKDPDARKDWRQEEKGMKEDEMVGWHHWLDIHEYEHALGVGDRRGGLACCSPWGHKEWHMTEQLNWTELDYSSSHGYFWTSEDIHPRTPSHNICCKALMRKMSSRHSVWVVSRQKIFSRSPTLVEYHISRKSNHLTKMSVTVSKMLNLESL